MRYGGWIGSLLESVKGLEETPEGEMPQARQQIRDGTEAIIDSFFFDKQRIQAELHTLISEEEFLDYRLRHEAAFARALSDGIVKTFGEGVEAQSVAQFNVLEGLINVDLFSNPLMEKKYPNSPTPLAAIDSEIAHATSYRGDSPEERSSRRAAIERNMRVLEARRRVLRSGFTNLPEAQRISSAIEEAKKDETDSAEIYSAEVRRERANTVEALQREYYGHIRHVGPETQRRYKLREAIAVSYGEAVFANPIGDNLRRARSIYRSLPMEKKREVLPQIFEKNIDHIIGHFLRRSDSPFLTIEFVRSMGELFDASGRGFNPDGYGFENYVSDNPDHFARTMKRLYHAVLEHTIDDRMINIFFDNQVNPNMDIPFHFSSHPRPKLLLKRDLYGRIVDDDMTNRASRIRDDSYYRVLEEEEYMRYADLRALFSTSTAISPKERNSSEARTGRTKGGNPTASTMPPEDISTGA